MIDRDRLLTALEELRKQPTEDAVLDLMDRVVGWCPSADVLEANAEVTVCTCPCNPAGYTQFLEPRP